MKAITLLQPWASLVADGAKKIETRSWGTKHRGLLAIHAGKGVLQNKDFDVVQRAWFEDFCPDIKDLPRSQVLCIVDLIDCKVMTSELIAGLSDQERAFGEYAVGRYAWYLKMVEVFEQGIPAKGMLGLWNWDGKAAGYEEKPS